LCCSWIWSGSIGEAEVPEKLKTLNSSLPRWSLAIHEKSKKEQRKKKKKRRRIAEEIDKFLVTYYQGCG
jgi:hypothetical protein